MQSIITSYLLQNKECVLPSIGILKIETKPAEIDFMNNRLLPPAEEIIFRENATLKSPELARYISHKKNISKEESEELLNKFCNEWKEKMSSGDVLTFETFGSLQKNAAGNIYFKREKDYEYFKPVIVNPVKHQIGAHEVLVGDKIGSTTTNGYYGENTIENSRWRVWAEVLTVIGAITLIYFFSTHGWSPSNIGNQNHVIADSAAASHFIPGE